MVFAPTIGIVTALPEEFAAMEALLDGAAAVAVDDDRAPYIAGELPSLVPGRPHQVALTIIGDAGNDAAATACTNLARTFRSTNIVVMVGIAAGVPSPDQPERHVRLGDVVVASWGVIGFDHVDQLADGPRLRHGFPVPSPLLVQRAALIEAREYTGRGTWTQWLDLGGSPALPGYGRPAEVDNAVALAGAPGSEVARLEVPAGRGGQPLPRVHYGLIGSSERSLRDARVRDALAARHNLRALEMEGKGIGRSSSLNGLEWFVIRGISDHGDSGTEATWRRYAALAAAAYLRGLLAETPPLAPRGGHPRSGGVARGRAHLVDDLGISLLTASPHGPVESLAVNLRALSVLCERPISLAATDPVELESMISAIIGGLSGLAGTVTPEDAAALSLRARSFIAAADGVLMHARSTYTDRQAEIAGWQYFWSILHGEVEALATLLSALVRA
ncbi:5'-methylthioadenosine/S-adenosylhomocysteine nucleosidase family protein [Phytohabitans houttuyneae]|uniref:Nucleoside phosphorylase domain-containing protein n=1 Tax=Phytohabitans houttuyneae TaxID=1076126 RepID=A0A6V8K434_9ACTN|nr:hypothetical protein [Phytohabitans houttuyneae]GFJ77151.1 hypothetical protein Phou_013310 [Phytohabitans houttuyneae]